MVHGTGSCCSKWMAAASEWDGVVPRHGVLVTAREPAHSGMAGGPARICGHCIGWGRGVQAAATAREPARYAAALVGGAQAVHGMGHVPATRA